ncbi:MAG: hypothetical protein JXA33_07935, partial [Anaerolineae bacterium]|nr:hypothetical protein [Anaerolineae bacterium]
ADGTADQPIRMVANGTNGWRSIRFEDTSVDAQADAEGHHLSGNLLRHVEIEGSTFGINVLSATPYLAHLDLDATTVVSQSISGSLGATPLWLMDSVISGGETAVVLTGAVNAHRNVIAGVGLVVITGPVTIGSNTFSGGGIAVGYGGSGTISNNVIAGGGIYIDGVSSIQQNIVQGGSIDAPNTTTVLSNTVRGGGIVVGESSEVRGNDVSGASEWGIKGGFGGTILLPDGATNIHAIDNRIVGNQNGIAVASGLVQGNLIANNVEVGLALGEATVISNTFTGNRGSALKISWEQPLMLAGNNLEGNLGQYDLENTIPSSSFPTIDARNNWWGTTNTAIIQQRIFDGNDDHNFGIVLYDPMLTAPNTTAPAYVRAITLTPESPVGIQTVTFDVLFSREMDTGLAPTLEFYTPIQESWQTYTVGNSSWLLTRVRDITIDFSNNLWLATAKGASVRYANGSGRTYTTDNSGIATNNLMSVMIDKEGNRWFGHEMEYGVDETAKVSVLRSSGSWQIYSPTNSSLAGYRVTAITEDNAGNIWFGTHGGGLSVLHTDDTWQTYNPSNSILRSYDLNAIFADSKGNIWIGEEGISVLRVDGTWERYDTTNSSLIHNSAYAIFEDSNGNMWFGSIGGIHKLDPTGNWYFYNDNVIDANLNQAMSIAEDRFGNLWFGTPDGLSIFAKATQTWKTYTPENSDLVNRWVSGIVNESTGNLWVGLEQGINGISILGGNTQLTPTGIYWPTNDHYSATYDFNSLVPRGVYTLTVSNARMPEISGSMEIAPNSAYTFTVDYAGAIADTTPPPPPSVIACAAETPDALSAEWDASDPDSAITLYQYAIGTTSDGIEVVYWTSTAETSIARSSLTLLAGQTYYISVKARNEGGLWSAPGSVGVVAGSGGCVSNVTQWNIYLPLVLRN